MPALAAKRPKRLPPFLGRVADAFPGGVAYLDSDLVFTFCNEVQALYLGRAVDEVIGHHPYDVAPDNPDFWSPIESVVKTGAPFPQTVLSVTRSERPEEGEHHFVMTCTAYRAQRGARKGVFMTALEISPSRLFAHPQAPRALRPASVS